jgi:hypothetical protein
VSDSNIVTPQEAYNNYSSDPLKPPADGVMAITCQDCRDKELPVKPDPQPSAPDHILIDFCKLFKKSKNSARKAAEYLRNKAGERGWCYKRPKAL